MQKKKKRALTLLEIMIVIFLITLITGTIGYSMKGTMEKGRAFRTEQAREQLHDLLLIALAEEKGTAEQIAANPETYLKAGGLAKDPKQLLKDGWKENFVITVKNNKDFKVHSEAYQRFKDREKSKLGELAKPTPEPENEEEDEE